MSANQVQIPSIQVPDTAFNLNQQNINKVFKNIYGQVASAQAQINEMTIIGEVKIANLTVAQFQAIAGTNWLLCNGQSCVGTAYALLTSSNTVPNIALGSLNNFIRVN
jgi:hypothetical protein